jgi:hypothetical protein
LPPGYRAQIDERVALIEQEDSEKIIEPDLLIDYDRRDEREPTSASSAAGATAVIEPVKIPLLSYVEIRERRIEIVKQPNRELVAVIELLSPWNKSPGAGYSEYQAKRLQIIRQPIHLIELDLLLGGKRIQLSRPVPAGEYFAYISRADDRPNCDVYAWKLPDPLPLIPVPLQAPDQAVMLDLEKVFSAAFDMGNYHRDRGFRAIMPPTIPAQRQNWVAEIAKSAQPG